MHLLCVICADTIMANTFFSVTKESLSCSLHLNLEFLAIFGCKMVVLVDQNVHVHFRVSLCVERFWHYHSTSHSVLWLAIWNLLSISLVRRIFLGIFKKNKQDGRHSYFFAEKLFFLHICCFFILCWYVTQLYMSSFCMWTFDLEGLHSRLSIGHLNSPCIQLWHVGAV